METTDTLIVNSQAAPVAEVIRDGIGEDDPRHPYYLVTHDPDGQEVSLGERTVRHVRAHAVFRHLGYPALRAAGEEQTA